MRGTLRPLFPDQQNALDMLKTSIAEGHRRPLLQAPTGFGKTVLSAHIVAGARRKGNRVCFSVPALSLVDQTFERFVENGIDPSEMGILQADHAWRRPGAPIQIATAQTLARRNLPETDVVVIDEAHVRFKVYDAWMGERARSASSLADPPEPQATTLLGERRPPKLFIGLSATPWSKGLGKFYDDLIRPISIQELIDLGRLSKFVVLAPSKPDLSGVSVRQTVNGLDYDERELSDRTNDPKLVGDIVRTWLEKGRGRRTLCFAVSCDHARNLHDRFEEAGVRTAYVDADTPREERDEIGKRLASGEVEVVCNIGTLTTGVDWDVRCIVMARPTKSEMLFTQIIGRGLRVAEGKDHCLILDHTGNHTDRFGMVTDIDHDELDDGRPKPKAKAKPAEPKLPKECPECSCLVPPHMRECPACGHARPLPTFAEQDGQLAEFNGYRAPPPAQFKRQKGESVADALVRMGPEPVYAQIRWVQESRGRQDGWSAHKFRALFGDWPPGRFKRMRPAEPCSLLTGWIRAQDIAWAHRRNAEMSAEDVA